MDQQIAEIASLRKTREELLARIQVILDRITYPTEAVAAADLVGREASEAH